MFKLHVLFPEASCLPGRLLTPYVCAHKTLAEACGGNDVEFTTMATLVSWDSSPTSIHVQLCRILDLEWVWLTPPLFRGTGAPEGWGEEVINALFFLKHSFKHFASSAKY